jgi:hypothetical protein
MKLLLGLAFAVILGALISAGVLMIRGGRSGDSKGGGMMRALAVRIAVSVLVFACIVAAWALGWIQPTGLPLSR